MSEDAGAMLLAAIEALTQEVKSLRAEASEDRDARKTLQAHRAKKAERQKRWSDGIKDARKTPETRRQKASTVHVLDLDHVHSEKEESGVDARKTPDQSPTKAVWAAYLEAYLVRYGVAPTWNARVGGQLTQLIRRVPREEAPALAVFYVAHNARSYVEKSHSIGLLLINCESLRTEWLRNAPITQTGSRMADETQERLSGWEKLKRRESP